MDEDARTHQGCRNGRFGVWLQPRRLILSEHES
jgi:hypothetical protein